MICDSFLDDMNSLALESQAAVPMNVMPLVDKEKPQDQPPPPVAQPVATSNVQTPSYEAAAPDTPPAHPTVTVLRQRNKAILCKEHLEGRKCTRSHDCPFLHIVEGEVRPLPESVCSFHLTSACLRDNCRFFHGTTERLNQLRANGATTYRLQDEMPVRSPPPPPVIDPSFILPPPPLSALKKKGTAVIPQAAPPPFQGNVFHQQTFGVNQLAMSHGQFQPQFLAAQPSGGHQQALSGGAFGGTFMIQQPQFVQVMQQQPTVVQSIGPNGVPQMYVVTQQPQFVQMMPSPQYVVQVPGIYPSM